jgi:hypothetical protein
MQGTPDNLYADIQFFSTTGSNTVISNTFAYNLEN